MTEEELNARIKKFEQMGNALELLVRDGASKMSITELHGLSSLWGDWAVGGWYSARQIVNYGGRPYMVIAPVNGAKDGDFPDKDTEHYKLMSTPDEDGVFPFSLPLGEADAYGRGDVVSLQGTRYVSLTDGNRSIPGQGEDGNKYWAKQ